MIRILLFLLALAAAPLQAGLIINEAQSANTEEEAAPPPGAASTPFPAEGAAETERPVITDVDTPLNHIVISGMMLLMAGSVLRWKRKE